MNKGTTALLCLALLAVAVAPHVAAVPTPTYAYIVSPVGKETRASPTCAPLVEGAEGAFLCYRTQDDEDGGRGGVIQFVNPVQPNAEYPNARVTAGDRTQLFRKTPIWIGFHTALVWLSYQESSWWTLLGIDGPLPNADRYGSVADVSFNPLTRMALVPFGNNDAPPRQDQVVGYHLGSPDANATRHFRWMQNFTIPFGFDGDTALQTPVMYEGLAYVMSMNTLYVLNGTNGAVVKEIPHPCGIKPPVGSFIHMNIANFDRDENGPLNAFIFYANTSTSGAPSFSFCRMSHHTFAPSWPQQVATLSYGFEAHSVYASRSTLFLSGRDTGASDYEQSFEVIALSIHDGTRKWVIHRTHLDRTSDVLATTTDPLPNTNCSEGLAFMQIQGRLSCVCLSSGAVEWTSELGCSERPLLVSSSEQYLACIQTGQSAHLVRLLDGSPVWLAPIPAMYTPSFVGGLLWFVDSRATLFGIDLLLPPPGPTPSPAPRAPEQRDGLSDGAIATIAVAVILLGGAAAGAVVYRIKRIGRPKTDYVAAGGSGDVGAYGAIH